MYPQSQNRRLFPIIVGVYGALWAVFSLLMLFFGLTNISGRGMEGLAAQVAIIFGIPSLIFAVLLLVCAVGLWQEKRWALVMALVLAILNLAIAVLISITPTDISYVGFGGIVLSVVALWYIVKQLWFRD
jgi:succinate-acetate transporter protein